MRKFVAFGLVCLVLAVAFTESNARSCSSHADCGLLSGMSCRSGSCVRIVRRDGGDNGLAQFIGSELELEIEADEEDDDEDDD